MSRQFIDAHVDMHERSFDVAQLLQAVLSCFSQIVSFGEGASWGQNNIYFDDLWKVASELDQKQEDK